MSVKYVNDVPVRSFGELLECRHVSYHRVLRVEASASPLFPEIRLELSLTGNGPHKVRFEAPHDLGDIRTFIDTIKGEGTNRFKDDLLKDVMGLVDTRVRIVYGAIKPGLYTPLYIGHVTEDRFIPALCVDRPGGEGGAE